jgi:uncharacterized protein (DUF433 family)
MASVATLHRPLYSYAEAARLLDLPTTTLRWWLEGARRGDVDYPPVIRPERTGGDAVTWGEFVEAGLLRGYRQKSVPLQRMRPFIEKMRERMGVPYPLAHYRPLIDPANRKLVYDLQLEANLPPDMYLVEFEGGQTELAPPILEFLERVEFDQGVGLGPALRYWPAGRASPVAIDPKVAFGEPQIRGIRTELVAESVDAGESEAEASASWGLSTADVRAAIAWEHRKAA